MTNLLPLDSVRKTLGWHPFHFWGMADSKFVPVDSGCNAIICEHSYQDAYGVGRDQIREAVETAERKIMTYLEYPIAPIGVSEMVNWPGYFQPMQWRTSAIGGDMKRLTTQLKYGKIQAVGVETYTALSQPLITYQDLDGDGYNESWMLTFVTVETDPTKIVVAFLATDRTENPLDIRRWTIAPLDIQIATGTCTVRGKVWLVAKPLLYESFKRTPDIDPTVAANLITHVQIYIRTINPDGVTVDDAQAVLYWNTDFLSQSQDPAAIASVPARAGIQNGEWGLVVPAEAHLNSANEWVQSPCPANYREPDQVLVRYYAGVPLDANGEMDYDLREAVTRMAMAELGRPACGCADANKILYHWQQDMARGGGRMEEQFQISQADLNNPFGTSRGHIWAWKRVKDLKLMRGIAI